MANHTQTRPKIDKAGFTVSWITTYPTLMAIAMGTMLTRAGYQSRCQSQSWLYAWQSSDRSKSAVPKPAPIASDRFDSFWGRYVQRRRMYWALDDDTAWDLVVPLRRSADQIELSLPGHGSVVSTGLEVLFYPTAIAVVARAELAGLWSLDSITDQIAVLRNSTKWAVSGRYTMKGCPLDEIAVEMVRGAAEELGDRRALENSDVSNLTVAALTGVIGSIDATVERVRTKLAGLAELRSEGRAYESGFLEPNRLQSHSAQTYACDTGHVVWPTSTASHNLNFLMRSHTELVAHIAALSGVAVWAKDQIDANLPIPVSVQPLIQRAVFKLKQLHEGDLRFTYRSGIAKARIDPLLATLETVEAAL